MNCRLCDKSISGKNGLLLHDYNENVETKLGRKINIILNSTEKHKNLSNYCCRVCSFKIELCFSLLVEIQASDEIIKQTYKNLAKGKHIDTGSQMFICGECNATISGIKLFTKHYESHILKKTTVGSKRDIVTSAIIPCEGTENTENYLENIFGNKVNNSIISRQNSLDDNEAQTDVQNIQESLVHIEEMHIKNDFLDDNDNNSVSDYNEEEIDLDVDDSVYELKPSSPLEFEDSYYFDGSQLFVQMPINDFDVLEKDRNKLLLKYKDRHNTDEIETQSIDSFSSDVSYTNLVNTVKAELENENDNSESELSPDANGMYSCDVCNISFEYKFILKYHLDTVHEAFHDLDLTHLNSVKKVLENEFDPLVKCSYCKSTFSSSEIRDHVEECRKEFFSKKKILCRDCGKFYKFHDLEKHFEEHGKPLWSCHICNKKFKGERFLKSHLGEHDESKKKVCEICGKKVLSLSFFTHVSKHREPRHVCQYCGKAFTYNYGLRIHMRVHDNKKDEAVVEKKKDKVYCWFCKKDFTCAVSLNEHLKIEHHSDVEQSSRFPCAQCEKKFPDMFSLKAHLKLIHEMKDEDIARLKSLPVYRYIECNVCFKVFNSENKVRIHMKQDHGLKPFEMEILKKECEKCGKKFASKQNLIHHINGAHLNIKPMECDICHEKFAKHSSLIYHKLRHSGEKPFQCEFCKKSYRQRNDVIRHLARHVRDKELTLEEASAVNNSPSRLVLKRRIFLKDSSINYKTIVKKNRRKSEASKMEPILEEEINEVQEEQMVFNENGIPDSMLYVEEVPVDENQIECSPDISYINAKPVYDEERNTIILSNPEGVKSSVKNITYRYVPTVLKHVPAVIVKQQEHV